MTGEYRAYRKAYYFLTIVLGLIFRIKPSGRENIPQGPAMICANHSSNFDPILICLASGIEHHLHIMGKVELFRIPILSWVLRRVGMFPVDRGNNDVGAIKTALKYLKAGEKVLIFPEGTRVGTDNAVAAKAGAVRIADTMNVPVIPVYVPRRKLIFGRCPVIYGKPFHINPDRKKLSSEDYREIADELMDKIYELNPEEDQGGERLQK